MSKIIGLDPGTINTGFAVLEVKKDDPAYLIDYGVLTADSKLPIEKRLLTITKKLEDIYQKHPDSQTAIEKIFLGKNTDTAFKLGMMIGAFIYKATFHHSKIASYSTRFIKHSITGKGSATKEAVKNFICNYFQIQTPKNISFDTSDAIAVALCHSRQNTSLL